MLLLEGRLDMRFYRHFAERSTQYLLAILALGVWGLLLRPNLPAAIAAPNASPTRGSATFDTLTVQRINVVDAQGKTRLVIANSARFPDVKVRGKVSKRSIDDAAGLVFYDVNGEETGGVALATLGTEEVANLTLDYTHQLTDGIRIIKRESADGARWQAGFEIFDRRPYVPGEIESSQGVQRVALTDEDHNAQLVISDTQGRPRIRIGVDASGMPTMAMLDQDGKVVYLAGR
jgi:hypothetical protein